MSSPLALSREARPVWSRIGAERQPLLEVAGVLADPLAVIAIAAQHRFARHGPHYPGMRAPVSAAIAMPLIDPLLDEIGTVFGLARQPRFAECYLSLVTTPPGSLAPIQRLPHFDGLERERLAVLLYLDRAERGGTGFYRQRATGFETVDQARFETYRTVLQDEVARDGPPQAGYIGGDTPHFERIHVVAGRFNTMAVYRGHSLHCAALPDGFAPDPDPASGRLTLNLFLG